jgi:twitching motility protein PilT
MALLRTAVDQGGSDVYIVPGAPATVKVGTQLLPLMDGKLSMDETDALIQIAYALAGKRPIIRLAEKGDDDFSFSVRDVGRFRCSAYKQRGSYAAVLRAVPFGLPDYRALGIPEVVLDLCEKRRGMILVTGPAGSGKSTTLPA